MVKTIRLHTRAPSTTLTLGRRSNVAAAWRQTLKAALLPPPPPVPPHTPPGRARRQAFIRHHRQASSGSVLQASEGERGLPLARQDDKHTGVVGGQASGGELWARTPGVPEVDGADTTTCAWCPAPGGVSRLSLLMCSPRGTRGRHAQQARGELPPARPLCTPTPQWTPATRVCCMALPPALAGPLEAAFEFEDSSGAWIHERQ